MIWLEFKDKTKGGENFWKNLKMEPILDESIQRVKKDLKDDECEIDTRTSALLSWIGLSFVVTLLQNIAYCYYRLHHYEEAMKTCNFAIKLAPIAADAYFRRAQVFYKV